MMGDDPKPLVVAADREHLMPASDDPEDPLKPPTTSPNGVFHPGREAQALLNDQQTRMITAAETPKALHSTLRSWASKKFMSGCVILLPIAVTFYVTWWFIQFVDGFFSPIYAQLGINIFGLGFVTSILFIFLVGVFVSSWVGASILLVGEWVIKRMPLVRHIYSASKQISAAISPDQNSQAFKEVAIIRHPRVGEYAFGFITSSLLLQTDREEEELCCVYVPTNHLYIGDIILVNAKDVIRPNLSVREGIEIVVSGGMTMPQHIYPIEARV